MILALGNQGWRSGAEGRGSVPRLPRLAQSATGPKSLRSMAFALPVAFISGSAAVACEESRAISLGYNSPTKYAANCRFVNAGDTAKNGRLHRSPEAAYSGDAVVDIGNQLVAQKLHAEDDEDYGNPSRNPDIGTGEALLVTDCKTGESAVFVKVDPSSFCGDIFRNVVEMQPPHGPIALTPSATIASLKALAKRDPQIRTFDPIQTQAGWSDWDRFDPHCGCKVLYPGSKGAKQ